MARDYTVSGLAVPESIDLLRRLLAEARTDFPSMSDVDASMIEMAVVEIAGNVVRHAPEHETIVYSFRLDVLDDRLVGVLEHSGPEVTAPDGAVVDELRHDFVDDRNVWTMVRLREAG